MPHSGQQPVGRGVAVQCAAQAASASRPPKSRARATQAAPSDAMSSAGRQPLHQAVPADSNVG
eukprot:14718667-Alexandrium_andersonii.AAC.1